MTKLAENSVSSARTSARGSTWQRNTRIDSCKTYRRYLDEEAGTDDSDMVNLSRRDSEVGDSGNSRRGSRDSDAGRAGATRRDTGASRRKSASGM